MRQVILDTNVLVAALRSKRGASYELVRVIGQGDWRPVVSVALALEYEDVLKRPGMVTGLSDADVDDLLKFIFRVANLVQSVQRRRPSLPDANDEHILELALECGAAIVTHNQKDFPGAERLGVRVDTPKEFLKALREGDSR
jgi:putative PIN family toxin of toxin-antitoxin system